ncbi:DNA primase [Yersinia proxima]|uniref:DNA primase n=1 Tax=Yersinia proxima TaxID=2890316 RepID=UPI001D12AE45|nr:DNA primase [Yersinia proxima]
MGKKIKIQGFAHMFGFGAKATEENEDDKDKAKKAKGRQAEEDEKDPDAEENDDDNNPDDQDEKDPNAEDDSDDVDADEGSDDDGDDDTEDRNVKKGRSAERQRCTRIFGSKHATGRGDLAVSLALNSGMSSAAVIRVLASTSMSPAPATGSRKRTLDERMQAVGNAQPGQDAAAGSKGTSLVNKMTNLYDSAKGKK